MPGTNKLYDEHELEDLPAELQPIPEMDWSDLSSPAVHRMVDRLPHDMLEDVPGDGRLVTLPERMSPICRRELLYTAVTRAERKVTVVATREVTVKLGMQRRTGLEAKLMG